MIDTINNVVNNKSIDTYKIIEDRYLTLKKYLRALIKENRLDIQNVECILEAFDRPQITDKELKGSDN